MPYSATLEFIKCSTWCIENCILFFGGKNTSFIYCPVSGLWLEMVMKSFGKFWPNSSAWQHSYYTFLSPTSLTGTSTHQPVCAASCLLIAPFSTPGTSLGFPALPPRAATYSTAVQGEYLSCLLSWVEAAWGGRARKPKLLPGLKHHATGRHRAVWASWWVKMPARGSGKGTCRRCGAVQMNWTKVQRSISCPSLLMSLVQVLKSNKTGTFPVFKLPIVCQSDKKEDAEEIGMQKKWNKWDYWRCQIEHPFIPNLKSRFKELSS